MYQFCTAQRIAKTLPVHRIIRSLKNLGVTIQQHPSTGKAGCPEKLDPQIKLYFGAQKHPRIDRDIGEWKTNKKTNGFNKSDKEACDWTFLSAILELQERAQKEGGNAVVGIKSNYKSIVRSSETEYMCGSGALMSGVALKGRVVKLAR